MAVLSKLTEISLPYNCYEVLHSWHPDCNTAALVLGASVFYGGLKLYLPFYVVTQILRGNFSLKACVNILTNVLVSSSFLGFHGFGIIFFSCLLRKHLGRFYLLTYFFIPAFITCFLAIFIERKNRRLPLTIYETNVATETVLRMALARGIIKPVPNAEIYLFSMLTAINLYIAKKCGYSEDTISSIFKFILGENEAKQSLQTRQTKNMSNSRRYSLLEQAVSCGIPVKEEVGTSYLQKIWSVLKHSSCPHDESCMLYCLQGFFRPFLIGYIALSASRCFSSGKKLLSNPSLLFSLLTQKRNLSLGLFLGGFGATFRIINCLLRWYFAKDHETYAIAAGLLAGLCMKFFPSSTISLYIMWKTIEFGYLSGIEAGILPHVKGFPTLLFSASTALLLHAMALEPHNLKPSFWRYMQQFTNNRTAQLNRRTLDIFGTHASKMNPDFWPELDHRYTSEKLKESALLWINP